MTTHKRPNRRQLRTFGLAFGGGLTVLGGILWWRGITAVPPFLWGVAAVLWLLALVAPRALRPVEKVMATIFRAVTAAITAVLLTIFYFLVMTPIGLVMRVTRKDFLGKRFARERESYWVTIPEDGPWSRPEKPFETQTGRAPLRGTTGNRGWDLCVGRRAYPSPPSPPSAGAGAGWLQGGATPFERA